MTPHHFSRSWGAAIVAFVCFFCCSREAFCAVNVDHLNVGFSATPLNWVESNGMFLYSINHSFAFGFWSLTLEDGIVTYYLCIQHLSSSQNVWCANRNSPVGRADLFSFNNDGSVDLEEVASGTVIWSINSGGEGEPASRLQLQETGNLVLVNNKTESLWQSFDYPTDTILSGQTFSSKMKLIASKSPADISEGFYYMSMNSNDSDLDLYVNVSTSSPQVFWTMESDGRTTQLNPAGVPAFAEILMENLVLLEIDGVTVVSEILLDNFVGPTIRRATLESDGNLHVYFFSGSLWNSAFMAVQEPCSLPVCCGGYGLCSNNGQCSCPIPLLANNSTDFSQGCSQSSGAPPSCLNNQSLSSPVQLSEIGNVDYYANQFTQPQGPSNLDECKQLCLSNCSCTALFFHNETGSCYVWGEIGTIRYDSSGGYLAFLKVLQKNETPSSGNPGRSGSGLATYVVSLIAVGTTFIIMGLFIGAWWVYKRRFANVPKTEEDDDMITLIQGLPMRFSYKELEAATNGFRDKLGSGGFGSVYEGFLGETKIAVKRLEGVGQGKKEFWAEVATIGSIHHVHLVQLRGFCVEGSHRLLVYEFMANGCLARVLFSRSKDEIVLDWPTRCNISVGTARGLAYLHDDCRERIIHCDIKPENILLDEHFVAKVADFGLAKLMNPAQSEVFTTLRGTRGYLAPEWLLNSSISDRSDVYSFGMVLLELISGRKNFDPTDFSEKGYFPIYAFCRVEIGDFLDLVDPRLNGLADLEQVAKLARIALWCIQDEVAIRPSMKKVVKMLEGIVEVPNPPQSPQLAVRLHGRRFDCSENDSGLFDFDKSRSSSATSHLSASRLSAPR